MTKADVIKDLNDLIESYVAELDDIAEQWRTESLSSPYGRELSSQRRSLRRHISDLEAILRDSDASDAEKGSESSIGEG